MLDIFHSQIFMADTLMAYTTYAFVTASPGPGNTAIMFTAMSQGRQAGLLLTAGILLGSQCWGLMSATGLASLMTLYPNLLRAIAILGGCYFIYLAYKAMRSACHPAHRPIPSKHTKPEPLWACFLRGFSIQILNPKSILGWATIISIGIHGSESPLQVYTIVGGCLILGSVIFGSYALVFSTPRMIALYEKSSHLFQGILSLLFLGAGLGLILK